MAYWQWIHSNHLRYCAFSIQGHDQLRTSLGHSNTTKVHTPSNDRDVTSFSVQPVGRRLGREGGTCYMPPL